MHGRRREIEALGARLVFIGNGSPAQAADFRDKFVPRGEVYTDPHLGSYDAIGAKRSVLAAVGPAVWRNGGRAREQGFRQGPTQGSMFQLGGVLVVLAGGRVAYRHLSDAAGDHPPVDDVINALRAEVGGPRRR